MTIKEWLNRGWWIEREIQELEQARKEALEAATHTTSCTTGERVKRSRENRSEQTMIAYADKVTEYVDLIEKKIADLVRVKTEIIRAVGQVKEPNLRAILTARYINLKKWEPIAEEMNYSWQHLHKLHQKALREIEAIVCEYQGKL